MSASVRPDTATWLVDRAFRVHTPVDGLIGYTCRTDASASARLDGALLRADLADGHDRGDTRVGVERDTCTRGAGMGRLDAACVGADGSKSAWWVRG